MNSAELLAKVKNQIPAVEEKSAKGFRNPDAMALLFQLQGTMTALLAAAVAECSEAQ